MWSSNGEVFSMCIQVGCMLSTWARRSMSFILCIWRLLETWVCICTDLGRTCAEQVPAGSSVWCQACFGGVEMFSSTLQCSGCGALMLQEHRWDPAQSCSRALEKITSVVGCRLSDETRLYWHYEPLCCAPGYLWGNTLLQEKLHLRSMGATQEMLQASQPPGSWGLCNVWFSPVTPLTQKGWQKWHWDYEPKCFACFRGERRVHRGWATFSPAACFCSGSTEQEGLGAQTASWSQPRPYFGCIFWPTVGLVAVRKRFEGKSYEGLLRAIRSLHPCTSVSHLHVPLSTSAKSFVA